MREKRAREGQRRRQRPKKEERKLSRNENEGDERGRERTIGASSAASNDVTTLSTLSRDDDYDGDFYSSRGTRRS